MAAFDANPGGRLRDWRLEKGVRRWADTGKGCAFNLGKGHGPRTGPRMWLKDLSEIYLSNEAG
jgi:hypothetical protein